MTGNDKTRDNVVRRELRLTNRTSSIPWPLKRSFQRLNNLNFFETVEILPQQVDVDKVDLNVKVKESRPVSSASAVDSALWINWWRLRILRKVTSAGTAGWAVSKGSWGQARSLGLVTFRNPYVNDSCNALQLDIYRSMTNYLSYFESKSGQRHLESMVVGVRQRQRQHFRRAVALQRSV